MTNHWALLVAGIAALGTFTVVIGFARSMNARRANTGESLLTAAWQLIDTDHRRYGGQFAHLGVMIMVIGVAGSSLYDSEELYQLAPGESAVAGSYTFTYHGLREVSGPNYTAVQADITVVDGRGNSFTMEPQRRFFRNWEEKPHTSIALRSTMREDFYVALAGWEGGGKLTALKVKVNPLVIWLWIGSIVMGIGAMFCMFPRLTRRGSASRQSAMTDSIDRDAAVARQQSMPVHTNGSPLNTPSRPRHRPEAPPKTTPQTRPVQPTHSETEITR